jgi:arsenical pump membrane protein
MAATTHALTWGIAAAATTGVIARPFDLPEAVWAIFGGILLVMLGLLPWHDALNAIGAGLDVYLFLAGMMLLSEISRREGLFDWFAALSARLARGSARRLFFLIYVVGIVVTTFLSNDACAVVLTPAVYSCAVAADADPLPYLFVCAFIANAASFVLPISNPANLVLYGSQPPALADWMRRFGPSAATAIVTTYVLLRFCERSSLRRTTTSGNELPALSLGGWSAAIGIVATAVVLLIASAKGEQLGWLTFAAGMTTAAIVLLVKMETPWLLLGGISWSVIPLVAGLFLLVAGLAQTGLISQIAGLLETGRQAPTQTAIAAGLVVAFGSNLTNNLPAGMIASSAISLAHPARSIIDALMIGVDLGPNLSITGSLATILWLLALRREGVRVGFFHFLRIGLIVMPASLVCSMLVMLTRG